MTPDGLNLEALLHTYCPLGFHLSRRTWEDFSVAELISDADIIGSANVPVVRSLVENVNDQRLRGEKTKETLNAGQLITAGVIVDVLRYVANLYCHEEQPGSLPRGRKWVQKRKGAAVVEKPPPTFVELFPPPEVLRNKKGPGDYLKGDTGRISNSDCVTAEMVLLALSMINPAFRPFRELFDDTDLERRAQYKSLFHELDQYFEKQPPFAPLGMTLFESLRAPMRASPDSLDGQLEYIKEKWSGFLPAHLVRRLLLAADILREEERLRGFGTGPLVALDFRPSDRELRDPEFERYSRDADWMSNVVLIAKSTHVWLDQLSKKYKRHIRFLSDIPDEELDRIASWGFTGLWLIGLWQRSNASRQIKQMMGNPEAVASAYSLHDYSIADDLGGEPAFENLRDRCSRRGIRLASDMVPNHVGIDSRWLIQHPDWFIQSRVPPFPNYRFSGHDFSNDERVGIYIEDGYWERRDASVVFKRLDKWTGDTRYIYHGNDGTNMPWNDTAQLNFLLPEVREAVIQTILHVARKFSVIRFDAAMTLAKRHFHRLWFPAPGEGGAIPSRAERGMTREEFDRLMPTEFWREVVDRVAAEVPDTLLLAEAFWLMEGYFVRTLGMHRVYNSAFMNMLKMEDNAKYRTTIKNVLEFSPEILKRFVNFMNNPDEETAVAQFGKGDKYFGVALMLATMPGLPMFGHGQIEGFAEKYGMEYKRAYWDEHIDEDMVRRHEHEIFPLMRRRSLFSGAENFALFDFQTSEGWIDENVFAYSNRAGGQRALIIYNNAYSSTSGRVQTSSAINVGSSDHPNLIQRSLAEALALSSSAGVFYVFRDHRTGLEYLRSGARLANEGLWVNLQGYQYHALVDFREIYDSDGTWSRVEGHLKGAAVPSVEDARHELELQPILEPLRGMLDKEILSLLDDDRPNALSQVRVRSQSLFEAAEMFFGSGNSAVEVNEAFLKEFQLLDRLNNEQVQEGSVEFSSIHNLYTWMVMKHLRVTFGARKDEESQRTPDTSLVEEYIRKTVQEALTGYLKNHIRGYLCSLIDLVLSKHDALLDPPQERVGSRLRLACDDPLVQELLEFNSFEGSLWLSKERLSLFMNAVVTAVSFRTSNDTRIIASAQKSAKEIEAAASQAGYLVVRWLDLVSPQTAPSSSKP